MSKNSYQLPEVLLPGSLLQLLHWEYAEDGPGENMPVHSHDFWQCNWVVRGSCEFHLDNQCIVVHDGEMIFIPPGMPHKLVYRRKTLELSFKYRTNLSIMDEVFFVPKSRESHGIIRAAEILVSAAFPDGKVGNAKGVPVEAEAHYQHTIEYLIAGTINFLLLKGNPLPEPADTLRRMLRKSGGAPLTVAEAARHCSLCRNQLCNLIKAQVGISAKAFIDRERALIASQFLKFSGMNIAEIADRMGFPTSGHFCKFFRRLTNCTPGQYREMAKLDTPPGNVS